MTDSQQIMREIRRTNRLGSFAIARLTWIDRKGAGQMRQGNAAILAKRLETLRCKATLRLLDGSVIGECYQLDQPEGRNRKWGWWYDTDALREKGTADNGNH